MSGKPFIASVTQNTAKVISESEPHAYRVAFEGIPFQQEVLLAEPHYCHVTPDGYRGNGIIYAADQEYQWEKHEGQICYKPVPKKFDRKWTLFTGRGLPADRVRLSLVCESSKPESWGGDADLVVKFDFDGAPVVKWASRIEPVEYSFVVKMQAFQRFGSVDWHFYHDIARQRD